MSMTHYLKTWPHEHDAVADGSKTFEVRDERQRSFGVGDTLVLQRWDPGAWCGLVGPGVYVDENGVGTDRQGVHEHRVHVTYVLHGGRFGIPVGVCVMGITLVGGSD